MISVIVPAFNSEKYIERALNSVIGQNYSNWEMIVIDDGSTDNTRRICDDLAVEDTRIVIISQENAGSSAARNRGLTCAKGEFVAFLDADDWYEPNFFSKLVHELIQSESDIVMCDFDLNGKSEFSYDNRVLEGDEILREFAHGNICNRIMNKIYRIEVVKAVNFPEGRDLMEDGVWTPYVLEKCKKITIISEALYHYYVSEGSVSRRRHRREREVVGYYKNLLERDKCILSYLGDAAERSILQKVLTDLETVLISCCNLDYWDVRETVKKLVKDNYSGLQRICTQKQLILLECVMNARSGEIDKNYHRKVIISFHMTLKDKAKLLKLYIIANYRRLARGK